MYEPLNEDKEDLGESVYAQLAKENESIVSAQVEGEFLKEEERKMIVEKIVSTV